MLTKQMVNGRAVTVRAVAHDSTAPGGVITSPRTIIRLCSDPRRGTLIALLRSQPLARCSRPGIPSTVALIQETLPYKLENMNSHRGVATVLPVFLQ
ncbi:MAG: hypothetical protein ND866_21220, partial [Pyrinomonadaceae bacterium]|nr:hypothetical protein [Pyrinomonadaceae bacterium]